MTMTTCYPRPAFGAETVECKTKAQAEKAMASGKIAKIIAGAFALAFVASDAPTIILAGSAKIKIVTRETSAPRIAAHGYSMVRARRVSGTLKGTADSNVSLHIHGVVKVDGGKQTLITLESAQDWCDYYGARVEDGHAILYKAVKTGYKSSWSVTYAPGSTPSDPQWDGKKRECSAGGGLNLSPSPRHARAFEPGAAHYLECRVKLDEIVCHFDGNYPEKVCVRSIDVPLIEVDVDGRPIDPAPNATAKSSQTV